MRSLVKVLTVLAFAAGLGAYPAAWALDTAGGREVLLVTAADEASVEVNRALWELEGGDRETVPSIYGTPAEGKVRLVLPGEERVLRPPENPDLVLYLKEGADHPLQAQTLYFFAVRTLLGGIAAGIAGLVALRLLRKTEPAPASP